MHLKAAVFPVNAFCGFTAFIGLFKATRTPSSVSCVTLISVGITWLSDPNELQKCDLKKWSCFHSCNCWVVQTSSVCLLISLTLHIIEKHRWTQDFIGWNRVSFQKIQSCYCLTDHRPLPSLPVLAGEIRNNLAKIHKRVHLPSNLSFCFSSSSLKPLEC